MGGRTLDLSAKKATGKATRRSTHEALRDAGHLRDGAFPEYASLLPGFENGVFPDRQIAIWRAVQTIIGW